MFVICGPAFYTVSIHTAEFFHVFGLQGRKSRLYIDVLRVHTVVVLRVLKKQTKSVVSEVLTVHTSH